MSASAFIAFFGVRFEITIDESEDEMDERVQAAREAGLQYYSGNFGGAGERYLLFVGAKLGVLGEENQSEIVVPLARLEQIMQATREKLRSSGFDAEPALYLQWEEDV